MLPKPHDCLGCPLYGDGKGFVPDEYVEGALVCVLGQNPGQEEERAGRPFIGKTGEQMTRVYFPLAGLRRGENVSIANTLRCRWIKDGRRTNDLPTGKTLDAAMRHCMGAFFRPPSSTRLIVAQGSLAWRAMGNETTRISDWRGFLAP